MNGGTGMPASDSTIRGDIHGSASLGTGVRISVILSAAALFMSGWSFLSTLDDDAQVRDVEKRLACLELPGPNDCGLDGR